MRPNPRWTLPLCMLAASLTAAPTVHAEEVVIKLGTLAPNGSPWHNLLKEMGQKWKEASGGKVSLRIYAGGTMGNEGDMVRKMRVGQLQAAAITSIGLHEITPEPQAVSAPMMIASYPELDYVMPRITPTLDKALEAKGFVVLNWGDAGFVRFFSTKAFATPAQAKDIKIFAWDGDPPSVDGWKAAGFTPVVLSSTDLVPSLQTHMIEADANVPLYAFTARIYQQANKMLDLAWSALIGAVVVKKDAWDKIPADLQPKLLEIAHDYAKRIDAEVRKMNEQSIEQMKAGGLQVIPVQDLAGWNKVAENANQVVRGKVVPATIFDEVKKLAAEYRSGKR